MQASPRSGEEAEGLGVAVGSLTACATLLKPEPSRFAGVFSHIAVVAALLLSSAASAPAYFETFLKAEYDSNVNRGINDSEGDGSFSVQLVTQKQPTGESRLEWLCAASLQATTYLTYDDLNYAELSLSPGLLYRLRIGVTAALNPIVQVRVVRDSAQSSVTVGGQASLSEQVSRRLYLTEYYSYQQSFARDDTYSFGAHSAGLIGSVALTGRLQGSLTYEFSYGDSFRGVGPAGGRGAGGKGGDGHGQGSGQGQGSGEGGLGRFSPAFQQGVIKEKVTRHAMGTGLQIDFGRSWSGAFQYVYSIWDGDSGTSHAHLGSFSIGRRF